MALRFSKRYAWLTVALFVVEVLIAVFVRDRVVRPFVGDMLVVILLFTLCRTFLETSYHKLAIGVLLFACAVEVGQLFDLVTVLGLHDSAVARVVIGTTFDPFDLLAYATGIVLVCVVGALGQHRRR